uniref:inositol-phosphate phosphatase n=1 Tax=Ditylenchus dipsaci TaxID=166011 RepID=A0A915D7V1_9BILA
MTDQQLERCHNIDATKAKSKKYLHMSASYLILYLAYLIWGSEDHYPELEVELSDVISYVVLATEMGGHAVVKIYNENNLNIKSKGETDVGKSELLTKADLVSNHLMLGLLQRFPLLKVITEEKTESMSESSVEEFRDDNYNVWLNVRKALEMLPSKKYPLGRITVWVDPLDATQEFTEGLTQYVTVMACVAIDGKPHFGAIFRPFHNETILGMVGFGLMDASGNRIKLKSADKTTKKIVVSRSHTGKVAEIAKQAFGNEQYEIEAAGGAGYKTYRLIQGTAELYLHTTAIKKWDICAGDAIIRSAGGSLIDLQGQSFVYSAKTEELNKNGMNSITKRNEDSLRRLRLRESYAVMMKDLEVILDEFRFNMSKTKSVVGFLLSIVE